MQIPSRSVGTIGAGKTFSSEMPGEPARIPPLGRQAEHDSILDFPDHPGFGATPQRLKDIFAEAECGYPQRQVSLFRDLVENDGHLRGLIEGRINAVAGKGWVLQPGDTDTASKEGAHALSEYLATANVHELLWHQLEYNFYGWAHSEIRWEFKDGFFAPVWFDNAQHGRFIFPNDKVRLLTRNHLADGEELIPGKWISSRARGSNVARAGLLRTCAWFALFKRYAVRDWVIAAEKFGIPFLLGKYNANLSPEGRATLEEALRNLGSDGQAIVEDLCEIEVIEGAQRSGDGTLHSGLIALCEAQLSKTITGATLTADTGQSGDSSHALGKVHSGVRFDLIQNDAAMMAQVIRRYIGVPFMKFNGFPGKAPILKSQIAQEISQMARVEIQRKLHEMGLPLSRSQLYEDHAIEPPRNDADMLVIAEPASVGDSSPAEEVER